MNSNLVRKLSVCILAVLISALPTTTALAAQPVFDSFHEEFTTFFVDCGDFDVYEDASLDMKVTTFVDADGNPVSIKWHGTWNGTIYSPETGKSLVEDTQHFNSFEADAGSGVFTFVGLTMLITLPRHGVVFLDVGRFIFTYDDTGAFDEIFFEAGPHPFVHGDFDVLCEMLA